MAARKETSNEIEGIFRLFNYQVKRLNAGDKIRIILMIPEDVSEEKRWIPFRGKLCDMELFDSKDIDKEKVKGVKGEFEVFNVFCKRSKSQDHLVVYLEAPNTVPLERALIGFRDHDCVVRLTVIERELIEREEPGNEEDQPQLPESD